MSPSEKLCPAPRRKPSIVPASGIQNLEERGTGQHTRVMKHLDDLFDQFTMEKFSDPIGEVALAESVAIAVTV